MTEPHIRVVAAVITRGDQLLVCQRPLTKRHGGLWEFPGGKCEPGESDFDSAQRELGEELGVEVLSVQTQEFAIADSGSPFLIAFVPVTIQGEPTCHEHTALRWDTAEALLSLPRNRLTTEANMRSIGWRLAFGALAGLFGYQLASPNPATAFGTWKKCTEVNAKKECVTCEQLTDCPKSWPYCCNPGAD